MFKKGASLIITFILVVLFLVGGFFIYYYYSSGTDIYQVLCNKSRQKIEKALEIYDISSDISNVQGYLTPEKLKDLKNVTGYDLDNARCPLGGKYFITSDGRVFCTLHGFGDRIPKNDKDFIKPPENEHKKKKKIKKESKLDKILNRKITYTAEYDKLYIEATDLASKGKVRQAIGKILKAIKLNPGELKYYETLIRYYKIVKDYDKVEKYAKYYLSKRKNQSVEKILNYVKSKRYFDLRLKRYIANNVKIAYFSYSVDDNSGNVILCDINGDNPKFIKKNLYLGDYYIGNNVNEFMYVNGDVLYSYDIKSKKENKIFSNDGYRIESLIYNKISKKFAFAAMKMSKGYEVYTLNYDGSDLLRITNNDYDDFPYDFSPDGKKLVFVSGNSDVADIAVVNAGGGKIDVIEKSIVAEGSPDWAKGRNAIVYYSYKTERNSQGSLQSDIFLYDVENDKVVNLTNSPEIYEFYPNWSNKNDKIVYAAVLKDGSFELFVMNSDGSGKKQITHFGQSKDNGWDYYHRVHFSLDDNFIVFSAGFSNSKNIYLAEIETGKVLQITDDLNDDTKPFIINYGEDEPLLNK